MKLRAYWDRIQNGLWFLPAVLVLLSVGLATLMVELDRRNLSSLLQSSSLFFGGSAEGARGVLTAIAGSLITVTGVVFSITIVALQLASTQFTPRVLQNFMKDRGNQLVLGVFLGTFTYTLLVLRTIRAPIEEGSAFVPGMSITVAVVLTLVSLGLLIYYLQHVASWIEASSIIGRVSKDTLGQIRKRFPRSDGAPRRLDDGQVPRRPGRMGASAAPDTDWTPRGEAATLLAFGSGYVERIDHDRLLELALEHDLAVRLEHGVGEFVLTGTPLLTLWPRRSLDADAALAQQLRDTVAIQRRRTVSQDAELGIIQLSDIAVKAMSPSINDPTTAMMAIDHLAEIIAELGGRAPRDRVRMDDDGHIRVVAPGFDFEAAVEVAFSQIRRYASADPAVLVHLAITLALIGERIDDAERQVLIKMLGDIDVGARLSIEHATDRRQVADAVAQAKRRLSRMGAGAALVLGLLSASAVPAFAQDTLAAVPAPAAPAPAPTEETSLTDTLVGSARHVVLALASDTWATLAAPFRLDAEEAWQVGGAVGVVALLMVFDHDIQRAIERNRDEPVLAAIEDAALFVEPVALMGNTNVYWASGMLIGHVTGQDRVRHVFEELLFSHWIASLTRKGLGRPIGRLRPFESPDDPFARVYWDGTSFPSGHASTAAQVAAVLAHHIDWWPADVVLYGLAASVAYERTASGDHWASDSVLGALWGYGVAQVVIARREEDRTDFVPFFDPGAGAVGVRVSTPF